MLFVGGSHAARQPAAPAWCGLGSRAERMLPAIRMGAQELELAPYLLHCERRLGEEYERCEAYLGQAVRKPLKEIVDRCLLEAHLSTILEGSRQLLAGCQEQDLARLYTCAAVLFASASKAAVPVTWVALQLPKCHFCLPPQQIQLSAMAQLTQRAFLLCSAECAQGYGHCRGCA